MPGPIQATQPVSGLVPVARPRRQIEADVSLKATDNRFKIEGDVFIGKRFVPAVVQKALNKSKDLRNITVTYQPGKDQYKLSGEIKVAGMWLKATGTTQVAMAGNDLVMRNVQFDFPGARIDWVSQKARDGIASALNGEGITSSRQGTDIRLSTSGLLQEAGVLPSWGSLSDDTTGTISHDREGNIAVHFGNGPAGTPDGTSHVKAQIDPAAGKRVLRDALGSKYRMEDATFENGRIQVKGAAAVPELRDGINAGILILGLLARDARVIAHSHDNQSTPYMPLGLELRNDGSDLVVKPSTRLALKSIAADLGKENAPARTTKEDVRVDAGSMLPEGKLHALQIAPDGIKVAAEINIDAVLGPALR